MLIRHLTATVSASAFALYLGDVLVGKAAVVFGWQSVPGFGAVGEFLLLLLAAAGLAATALLLEAERSGRRNHNEEESDGQNIPNGGTRLS